MFVEKIIRGYDIDFPDFDRKLIINVFENIN